LYITNFVLVVIFAYVIRLDLIQVHKILIYIVVLYLFPIDLLLLLFLPKRLAYVEIIHFDVILKGLPTQPEIWGQLYRAPTVHSSFRICWKEERTGGN
jgi:hypothetical protein